MLRIIVGLLFVALPVSSYSQTDQLREVKGRIIKSKAHPPWELEFGKDFKYAGGRGSCFTMCANAEQHFFVDADKDGRIKAACMGAVRRLLAEQHSYLRLQGDKVG
jgi:hypothetical protein